MGEWEILDSATDVMSRIVTSGLFALVSQISLPLSAHDTQVGWRAVVGDGCPDSYTINRDHGVA